MIVYGMVLSQMDITLSSHQEYGSTFDVLGNSFLHMCNCPNNSEICVTLLLDFVAF